MFDDLPQTPTSPSASPASAAEPRSEAHRALYLRFRPRRFADVKGQDHVTRTLRNAVRQGRPAHAYLFTGPRGTGKTSVARILYRAVNCEAPLDGDPCNVCALCRAGLNGSALDLVEIDAASTGGVADIRDLREKVGYRPNDGRYRVYIIDEAHEMSTAAWDALLKTLEEPPPHAMFVLATTEAHKVPPTIVSRCQRFDFRRIPFDVTRAQLADVAIAEGMRIEPTVLERLALVARGGLRDALSLLDQLEAFASAGTEIDMQVARAALSLPSVEAVRGIIDAMTRRDAAGVMLLLSDAVDGGADLRLLTEDLVTSVRALLLLSSNAGAGLADTLPKGEVDWLRERAPHWSPGALMRLIRTLSESLARTRDAQQFQVQVEVALLAACDVESRPAVAPPPQYAPASSVPSPSSPGNPPGRDSERTASPGATGPQSSPALDRELAAARASGQDAPPERDGEPSVPSQASAVKPAATSEPVDPVASVEAVATALAGAANPEASEVPAPAGVIDAEMLTARWPDVVDVVKTRNPILASLLGSASPSHLEDNLLVVIFGTEFNRKSAEKATHRQIIETAFERVYGTAYRLRCTVRSEDGGASLLEDPVINYATRTFGGQPRRVAAERPGL